MNKLKILFIFLAVVGLFSLTPQVHADQENSYQLYQEWVENLTHGTPWSARRNKDLLQKVDEVRSVLSEKLVKKTFPVSESALHEIYQAAQSHTITFFAYSSMIDREAGAVKAISPEGASTQIPAIAFGLQRAFNREMAAATVEGGWGPLKRPNDLAILNVFEKEGAVLNGVVFELSFADLLILTKREVGYDLIPVFAMRWNDAIDENKQPEFFIAYTFLAPDYKGEGVRYTSAAINPIPGYFTYLQKGLNRFGDEFKAMWWQTTYLADKQTVVCELPLRIIDLK